MFERHYRKGRQAYVIELVVVHNEALGPATSEVSLRPIIWSTSDGHTPMTFKSREEANKYLAQVLLRGETTDEIVAFSVKRMTLTVPRSPEE